MQGCFAATCGGPGDDRLVARGNDAERAEDTVDCGPGEDTARVDALDAVVGCETVRRG